MQISHGSELELVVPRGYELKEAEAFLHKKVDWILKHLDTTKRNESKYLLFGKEVKVSHEHELFVKKHGVKYENNSLNIISPSGNMAKTENIFEKWLREIANTYLPKRVKELAIQNGFRINNITIRGQKTRWGSCSSRGNLSFNYKLLRFNKEIIDYVIFHELCHLIEMNHSKKFWKHVEKYCPNYKLLRKELKGLQLG